MTNSSGQPKAEKDSWAQLAEILGVATHAEPAGEPKVETSGADEGPGVGRNSPGGASISLSQTGGNESAGTVPEAVPDRIPLKRWTPRVRTGGNWDEIASQLGLRKAEPESVGSAQPSAAPTLGAPEKSTPQAPSLERGRSEVSDKAFPEWLTPAEETIVPPPLDEASVVAVTPPPEHGSRDIIQAEVAPPTSWLEEQVVAPAEAAEVDEQLMPVVEDVVHTVPGNKAIAADTVTLQPVVPPDLTEGKSGEETVGPERKKRRRRRRKKRAAPPPVSPEPFEEELPEIVELATTEAAANGEDLESEGPTAQASALETAAGSSRTDSTSNLEAEEKEVEESQEEEDIPRPSHKAVPGWAEVVGYIIQKNMEARNRRPGYRDRRR